ncbi:hypothetical protein QTI66_32295 [Variovorax sp. J22R133]|uniref:hypothetical protein n=1 Tax=Variovorax brevis TaxID=3053503 RepID=UPI0025754A41|nr:hypothetical protein [Variovorax sp. J22R133]MDM0116814.1 hypothetical protein [Variovorax sp. J22R133]
MAHLSGPGSAPFSRPLPLPRGGWRRRIEVFSPKLGRRLSLGNYDAFRTWLAIEANPAIESFTERPAHVDGPGSAVIDFWVQLRNVPSGEFWFIEDRRPSHDGSDASLHETPALPAILHKQTVRLVRQEDLQAWSVPIANWSRIVPYLVSHRRFRDPLLEQSIVVYLGQPRTLDAVLEQFATNDATSVEASLFALVAGGRVESPDLAVTPLSGDTRFLRA